MPFQKPHPRVINVGTAKPRCFVDPANDLLKVISSLSRTFNELSI